jgi:hypothetical protein
LIAEESSGDLSVVLKFALLGVALCVLAIGEASFIDAKYMTDLMLLF